MQEVVTKTADISSTIENTERIVKILHITYTKAYLDEVSAAEVQLDEN